MQTNKRIAGVADSLTVTESTEAMQLCPSVDSLLLHLICL